jgi:tetratricopeptide (TPR) repeat protein
MQDMMNSFVSAPVAKRAPKASRLVRLCDTIITATILALVVLVPMFFLPWTIEVSELNKQLIIVVGAAIAGIAWLGKMLAERKLEYRRSIVNLMILLFLGVYGVSALLSQNRYMSLVGDFGQELAGFLTVASFVVLYFVIVNNVRTMQQLWRVFYGIIFGSFFVGLYALLQGFGVYVLPFAFSKTNSFNTVGTVATLAVYLATVVTLSGALLLAGHGNGFKNRALDKASKAFIILNAIIALILIAAADFWPVSVSLLVGSAILITFAFIHAKNVKNIGGILLPIAGFVLAALLLFFNFPSFLKYPAEVMPSLRASAQITDQTLRASPFFGSGPGTFIFDYSKFHANEVNASPFWNTRFDRSASRFLTLLATTGLFGALSWLMVLLFLLFSAARQLFKADENTWHTLIGVFAATCVLVIAKFIYSSTITLEFMTWVMIALLVIVHRKDFVTLRFDQSPRAAMGLSFIFILSLVMAISGVYVETQRYAAEIAYANAIRTDSSGGSIDDIISDLNTAANLNLDDDVYRRNLAVALLSKANTEYSTDVKVDRKKDESDTDYNARVAQANQDKTALVSQLTASAVNVAKTSTDIDPKNVADWSVLASVYESLMGVSDGADTWAVTSLTTAISLEPANPELHTELGKVYMYQSDVARQGTTTNDATAKAAAQKKTDDLLNQAVDEFNKAVALKSDYALARYNLSLALDRQGNLKGAISKMEDAVRLNPQDVGVGFQLALMYFRDGRKDDAISLLESVVQLSPQYANARWYLAAMYEDKGDFDDAIAQVTEVQKLNPGNDTVTQKLAELEAKKAAPPGSLPAPVADQTAANPNTPPEIAAPETPQPPAPSK